MRPLELVRLLPKGRKKVEMASTSPLATWVPGAWHIEYGLWQDFGTGKEIPRGNNGDIGREKRRVAKKWFSRKYYSSVLNLRDFLADNIGQSFVGVVAKALDDNYRRYNH